MQTYVSLFSSAGIGCHGFKQENFECIATSELIPRRLDVQKFNNKCKYDSGYILGDITLDETKTHLLNQVDLWVENEDLTRVDVVVATPPCQGMSVANRKRTGDEIVKNSLVVESIKIINELRPKFFVLENVPAFMKTICTDVDGIDKPIFDAIDHSLSNNYTIASNTINFKDYGSNSRRRRTLVIGVAKDLSEDIDPLDLFPCEVSEKTLLETIGCFPSLTEFGEIDLDDIYHAFRVYPEHMREWISCLDEGESAFDNEDDEKKPHQIINGELVVNKRGLSSKYTRQRWNKVGPCIHTRNDSLASQNTIHPWNDRVFSIRELMVLQTIPDEFKWVEDDFEYLNNLTNEQKREFLKREELKIRQAIGEAVPTVIFREIARNIKEILETS